MKMPRFLVVIGRACRYAPQFVIWLLVGLVSLHFVLRVMGVSWNDILMFWAAVLGGFIGASMMEKFMARRRRARQAEEQRLEDLDRSLVKEEKRWQKQHKKDRARGRNLDT